MRVPKPRLSSCASVFEERGDTWGDKPRTKGIITPLTPAQKNIEELANHFREKHGLEPFKPVVSSAEKLLNVKPDDPDFDRWERAKKALFKPEYVDPPRKERSLDLKQKIVERIRKGNKIINDIERDKKGRRK